MHYLIESDNREPAKHSLPETGSCDEEAVTPQVNPAYEAWVYKDRPVVLWLKGTLTERVFTYTTRAQMTQQAWTILSNIFRSSSRACTMYLKSELHGLRKGTLSVLDYVEKKCAIADNLASTNNGVYEEELIQCILTGLDVKFGTFRSALNGRLPLITI